MRALKIAFIICTLAMVAIGCAPKSTEETPSPAVVEVTPVDPQPAEAEPVEEQPVMVEETESSEAPIPAPEPQEIALYKYLIRPDDYLSKIAAQEYGDKMKWREIYEGNRELIGEDPNYILPYHEIDLFKPEDQIVRVEYDFTIHTVQSGESLWSIAEKEYGHVHAWIVILWDNDALLSSDGSRLQPGMELSIRTRL